MEILFIKSPRKIWAFNSELQNTAIPLAIPCLTAVLKRLDVKVKFIDCVPFKIGWKSLRRILEKQSMDIVCLSESELWGHESMRTANLVKELSPKTKIIAGGIYFSNLVEHAFKSAPIDYIAIGEGELTITELVKELEKPSSQQNFKKIKGVAYKKNGRIMVTPPRLLVENLDSLPFPDYSVIPMNIYSARTPTSQPLVSVEHSRGCPYGCTFCVCWSHMGERRMINGKLKITSKYRTKSVSRTIEEIELLYTKYGCKELYFVDNCWGVNPKWNKEFAEQILERKIDIKWFANFRADHIVRDERHGVLKWLVKAGMSHVCIGAESSYDADLKRFDKRLSTDTTKKAFEILGEVYPHVVKHATFTLDVRKETKSSLAKHLDYAESLGADIPVFHPLTPFPGTKAWEYLMKHGEIETTDIRQYDWVNPVIKMHHLSKDEWEDFLVMSNKKFFSTFFLKGLLSRNSYRRKLTMYVLGVASRYIFSNLKGFVGLDTELNRKDPYSHYTIPEWYEK